MWALVVLLGVDLDGDGFDGAVDCDDADSAAYPGAPDVCGDDRVTDCDRSSDDGLVTVDGGPTYTSLAAALAAGGSKVTVCPGTWVGPFTAPAPVELVGHGSPVLDGGGAGSTLVVPPGTTLRGLVITGGAAERGGGVRLAAAGALVVEGCTIEANEATGGGGGVALADGSAARIVDSAVRANTAGYGGGIDLGWGSTADLTGSVIEGNQAIEVAPDTGTGFGGGLYGRDAAVVGGAFLGNSASVGGGLFLEGPGTVAGSVVTANAAGQGGGVSVWFGPAALDGVVIDENTALVGGGLDVQAAPVDIVGGEISGNVATYGGGGFLACYGLASVAGGTFSANEAELGGGLVAYGCALDGVAVTGNHAASGAGGAWLLGDASAPSSVSASSITDNLADGIGGGLLIEGADVEIGGTEVLRNVALAGGGGAWLAGAAFGLESTGSDWGTGAATNAPDDVFVEWALQSADFAAEDFACDASGCSP